MIIILSHGIKLTIYFQKLSILIKDKIPGDVWRRVIVEKNHWLREQPRRLFLIPESLTVHVTVNVCPCSRISMSIGLRKSKKMVNIILPARGTTLNF